MKGIIDYDTQRPHLMGDSASQESATGLDTTVESSDLSPLDVFFSDSTYSREDVQLVLTAVMVLLLAFEMYDRRYT